RYPTSLLFPYTTLFRSLRVMSERSTICRYGPDTWHRVDHSLQPAWLSFSACSASTWPGSGKCEGDQVSTNGIRSPSPTEKLATRSEEHTSELQSRGHLV